MPTLRILAFASLATVTLTACSAWQNASRKYMEKQSYDDAGIKVHEENFVGCGQAADLAGWSEGVRDGRAQTFLRQVGGRFELRVEPAQEGAMACDYSFSSAEDRTSGTEAAITHTLDQFDAP